MNSMQVKDKLKIIAKNKAIDFNIVLKFYVFDRFIARLAKSNYKDNFIIKGGFLLSTLFGLENRSTMDIDSSIIKISFTEATIMKIIESIIAIDLQDNIKFSIKAIGPIREEDKYGGFRIHLIFEFENIKELLKLDIATGDPITPKAIEYKYKTILEDEIINIWSYNIETVLAEKLETILSKVEMSSRMKDYYDIYLICNKSWNSINQERFKKATSNTFKNRNFNKNTNETFRIIQESPIILKRWHGYSNKYDYAKNIKFDDILESLEKLIEWLQ